MLCQQRGGSCISAGISNLSMCSAIFQLTCRHWGAGHNHYLATRVGKRFGDAFAQAAACSTIIATFPCKSLLVAVAGTGVFGEFMESSLTRSIKASRVDQTLSAHCCSDCRTRGDTPLEALQVAELGNIQLNELRPTRQGKEIRVCDAELVAEKKLRA